MFEYVVSKATETADKIADVKVPIIPAVAISGGAIVLTAVVAKRAGMNIVRNYYNCFVLGDPALLIGATIIAGVMAVGTGIAVRKHDEKEFKRAVDQFAKEMDDEAAEIHARRTQQKP